MYFGSYGRKEHDFYSDLDAFIYLTQYNKNLLKNRVKERVREILVDDDGISNEFEVYDKWIVFTEKTFLKIEISIKDISEAKNDVVHITESRIPNPAQMIVYDKNNKISQIFTENWINLSDFKRLKDLFVEEIHKFIYYFEDFLSNLARDDEYRAYMNYTIAFYKLAGLKAMIEGEYYNLYQPNKFTTKIVKDWSLRMKYYRASASLRKYDMFAQRDNLKFLFLKVLEKGIKKFDLEEKIYSEIKYFFEKVDKKYFPFKNLRDIGLVANNFSDGIKLKEGLIYRAAALSKNKSELILKFLKENSIKYILDIRGKDELENYVKYNNFYDDDIKVKYVINIPFKTEVNTYILDKPYENFYYAFLKDFRDEIKTIFENYFTNASIDRLIIHCEGGKDRTGVIIALLLDLLGIERELILQDYLLSYSDTNREYIDFIFKTIDEEYGGTENFLKNLCNIPEKAINNIKKVLVAN